MGAGLFSAVCIGSGPALAADKSRYTFANPVPADLLRPLTTDRPDITESPFTVDAGHVQFEMTVFGYARSQPDLTGATTETYEFLTTNIRIGLANNTEIAFVIQPYGIMRAFPPPARSSGAGDFEIRAKFNLWGNDDYEKPGDTALALLPFVSIPIDAGNGIGSDATGGGLIAPLNILLGDAWSLGINAGIEAVANDSMPGHHAEFLASASLAHSWSDNFGTYYEIAGRFNTDNPLGDVVVLSTGFTYALNGNLQLDGGLVFGVTDAADRIAPFIGFSLRL